MTAPRPPRVTLGALSTGVVMSAQYNPDSLEEDLAVVYQKIKIQGLSHQVLQYEHTENYTASFDLAFDGLSTSLARGLSDNIIQARNWLQSLMVSSRQASSVATGGPTRVMFIWPGMIGLTCVITKLKFQSKRFAWTGLDVAATWFIVKVTIEEIRDTRLYAEDVAASGTLRTST